MKRSIIPLTCLLIILSWRAIANPILPEPEIIKLNDRVYALIGPAEIPTKINRGYIANSTIIIGDQGVILIDTGFSHEIGLHLQAAISHITTKPVTHIINTHSHGDHTLGNNAFKGAKIISSENCKSEMERSATEWIGLLENMTELEFPDTLPVIPTITYTEGSRTRISIQGVKLEIHVPAGSHTPGDLFVYLPEDGIVIAGDLLVNTMMPNFRDAHVGNWINTLTEINDLHATIFVPGHGVLMSNKEVIQMHHAM
jgi:glyoxylase-like metal-dependent hydrolase (beta-lactamase superfamily II)